jgi:acetyl esterase/lipase
LLLLGLTLVFACAPLSAQQAVAPVSDPAIEAAKESEPTPDDTMVYAGGGGRIHRIDIFRPPRAAADRPLPGLVMFHGGGWQRGDPNQFYRLARFMADRGFVVLTPAYSLESIDGTTPWDALVDAFSAFAAIVRDAEALGIDPGWIAAGGGSAGGQLAAALATVPPPIKLSHVVRPKALVLFNPVIDNGPDGYGYDRVKAYYTRFPPLHNIGTTHPPTLIMLGDQDELVSVETAQRYCRLVEGYGTQCVLKVYPGGIHSWFNKDGFSETLRDGANFLLSSRQALDR